ncbi:hypothetical protein LLH03_18645 [bacterium]|nr:hypothetical protein [bacterium]
MDSLTNFTVWGKSWFADGWCGLDRFCREHGLAGIELLASGATPEAAPPSELIGGVHLRSLGSWLPLAGVAATNFGEGSQRYARAESYGELVRLRAQELREAAVFEPQYAVWHACYTPVPQVFGGPVTLTSEQFLPLLARLVRDVLEEYRPSFPVCFENAWGVGLDYSDLDTLQAFAAALSDLPVGLVLDLGHHLNVRRHISTPAAACEELGRIAEGAERKGLSVEVLHLHWTPPEAPKSSEDGPPPDDPTAFFADQDQHRPLVDAKLPQAVQRLHPQWVVHELGAMSLEDHDAGLRLQAGALRGEETR